MKYDAHVRARRALIKRIWHRSLEWDIARDRRLTFAQREERFSAAAGRALALYKWPENWGTKLGPYHPFRARQVLGMYADVPTPIIHDLMVTAGRIVRGEL